MQTALAFIIAAVAEIAGCYGFWAHVRLGRSVWWMGPGVLSLLLFAYALTFVQADAAGRAYAAYGGIYIATSIMWLWGVEGVRPDRWDIAGTLICLCGMAVILFAPRSA